MNFLASWNLKQRLQFLIAIMLIGIICTGGVGYYFLNRTNRALHNMYTNNLMAIADIYNCRVQARKIEGDTFNLMLSSDDALNEKLMQDIAERTKKFDDSLNAYSKLNLTP